MASYLFYDIETSGLNPAFDQILQFAAIRTDFQLREVERHEIRIRLRPDVLISPGALITHRIPLESFKKGETEYAAVRKIHRILNEPGTISLGYNTLKFDDLFLRFSFYRNLLSPYTHQFSSGCSRMDLFPILIFFYLFKKEVLRWPEVEGRPSLKLENLSTANALAKGMAHDAMVDVEACLSLARILIAEKEMWDYLATGFNKKLDKDRMAGLPEVLRSPLGIHRQGLLVGPDLGMEASFLAPVLGLGYSIPYGNQSLWLRLDREELCDTDLLSPEKTSFVIRKRDGESPFLLPPAERFRKHLGSKRLKLAEENLLWLKKNPDILTAIIVHHREYRYPDVENIDPDAALYQAGFFSKAEEELCGRFHRQNGEGKLKLLSEMKPRLHTLASRLLLRNGFAPKGEFWEEAEKRLMAMLFLENPLARTRDWRGEPRSGVQENLLEIETLQEKSEKLDKEQIWLLEELKLFLEAFMQKK